MNWEKLETQHYFENPVEHVYTSNIFDLKEYHILYENQNNLNHQVWQQFDEKYKTGFEFKNDLTEIDFNKEVIALWFFKERSDRNSQPFIDLAGKLIPYYPNAFLLTTCKKIKIKAYFEDLKGFRVDILLKEDKFWPY